MTGCSLTQSARTRDHRSVSRLVGRIAHPLALLCVVSSGQSAWARPDDARPAKSSEEPSVYTLQRAAIRYALVEPERVTSWIRRVNKSALLPEIDVHYTHGVSSLQYLHPAETVDSPTLYSGDQWHIEVGARWNLDRLVFHHDELAISREAQRIAVRREALTTRVAETYFARKRLLLEESKELGAASPSSERRMQIEELTAVLDGLTGGALTGAQPK